MEKSHRAKELFASESGISQLACSRSSQSSLEYLLVIALTFIIIVPTTFLFYTYSVESTQELVDAQLTQIGRVIVDTVESIFYSGVGSKTLLDINMPENVYSALLIDGKELVFNITTSFGVSEIVFFSSVNMTTIGSNCDQDYICELPGLGSSGLKKLKIEAISQNSVQIVAI